MRVLRLFAAIALAWPGPAEAAADGYAVVAPEYVNKIVLVEIRTYPTLKALHAALPPDAQEVVRRGVDIPGAGYRGSLEVYAFTVHDAADSRRCVVSIVDPLREWRPERLGHEIAHCIYGNWHPAPGG
jgi:hypothetical protein